MSRVALNEDEISSVIGGFIEYKYSPSRGYGLAWINQEDDPEAAKIRYKFTDYDAFTTRFEQLYQKYGDYGILQALEREGLCQRV